MFVIPWRLLISCLPQTCTELDMDMLFQFFNKNACGNTGWIKKILHFQNGTQNMWLIAHHFCQMPLVLKMATPQQKSRHVVQLAQKESVRGVCCALHMQFCIKPCQDINLCGLLWKQAWLQSIVASETEGQPGLLVFANVPFLFGCLVSAGWLHMKLCAKWLLHSCCWLFLWQLQNKQILFLVLQPFSKLVTSSSSDIHTITVNSVNLKQNLERFSIDWCRCDRLSMLHLFSISF